MSSIRYTEDDATFWFELGRWTVALTTGEKNLAPPSALSDADKRRVAERERYRDALVMLRDYLANYNDLSGYLAGQPVEWLNAVLGGRDAKEAWARIM